MALGTSPSSYELELHAPPIGFAQPDWREPLDVQRSIARVPTDATAKGMFLARLMKEVTSVGLKPPTDERFLAFHDYPLTRHLELHVEVAALLYPKQPPREGLRRLAGLAYQAFVETHIGKILLGVMGRDPVRVLKLASKAMSHSASIGSTETEVLDDRTVIIRGKEIYLFPDCFSVGVLEGLLRAMSLDGRVAIRMTNPTSPELWIHWR